jgi:2-keto-4-pentenoate hydratase/2-oxohepta-3-ene-1,7-dioic acid hydratase in catechol pathway
MQIVFYDDNRLGVLAGDGVVDVTHLVGDAGDAPQARLEALIAGWPAIGTTLRDAAAGGTGVPLSGVALKAPVPRPSQLVCAAGNYIEPAHPEPAAFNAFLKATTSIVPTGATVELPDTKASVFHFEPELALVIGKRASHVAPAEAMDCVFGYLQFLDVSARGLPGGFFLGKSWHTFGPMGPVLVTADEVPDVQALDVELAVNGRVRQSFSTGEMARHLPELLAEVTKVMALEPGDVLATGTHHESLSPIQDGDRVRLSIKGLGPALEVDVHDALKRTWEVPGR